LAGRRCFSKTARSRPRHHEARRHGRHLPAQPERRRRFTHDHLKCPAERAEAVEADVEADVGDAAIRGTQQKHRALDAAALQIAVRRLAEGLAKPADEVRLRDARDLCEARDAQRLGKRPVHRIPRAQHAAIAFFSGANHLCVVLYILSEPR